MQAERKRLVVVGNGMVGHRFVEAASERGLGTTWSLTVFGAESRAAYDRVALSSYFAGATAEDLCLARAGTYDDVELFLGDGVVEIDTTQRRVVSASGKQRHYDALVLATGSRPFVPPVPGRDATRCFVYRTLDDLDAIREAAVTARTGVVIGGGLLGLEAANALQLLGLHVVIVELAPRLMPMQIDDGGGAVLRRRIEALGFEVRTGVATTRIEADDNGCVRGLMFDDGTTLATEIVVFSAGIRPDDALARQADLAVGERGGIVVNEWCETSMPDVYAIGECANIGGRVYGLVAPGYAMAQVVADRLAGGAATFASADTSTKLKLLGVDVASFGDAFATTAGSLELVYADHVNGVYKKLVVSDDARRLLGGVLVGDASAYAALRSIVAGGAALTTDPEHLLMPSASASVTVGVPALTGEAVVCSCHNVTADKLNAAFADGCDDIVKVKAATRAGTGCGSCLPLVKKMLADELAAAGRAPDAVLCEHFAMSRQQLFDVLRVQEIKTFSELVSRHGRGRGCDVCKPVVASILASSFNTHPLDGETAALQDTNDHVLANLQRDGSYSIVPRIPGGEIAPAGLIVIGEIARDFGLYTKITGGQHIDMFGARIEQLPSIWKRLVDAGFESGHAYGKSMRTVKSCVGSTWCRFGVQDSVALAIELELRYRGLRAPHKIKAGVSGCARECAEARSKDVGIIATERGWNLYVGGNGGFTPRHAQLLATDVDTVTLIRYVDRFLMYYVRTADRLQRTAAWIESLEGGLDHVKDVVVDDVLGLATELEADMARHVSSYSDEWAATLDDPEKLARFVSFVNAPATPDPDIVFVAERDQHRPARIDERAMSRHDSRREIEVTR